MAGLVVGLVPGEAQRERFGMIYLCVSSEAAGRAEGELLAEVAWS